MRIPPGSCHFQMYDLCNNSKHQNRKLDSWNSGFLFTVIERKKCNREKDVTKMKTKWFFPHCKGSIEKGLRLRRQISRQEGMDRRLRMPLQEWNGFKVLERKCVFVSSLGLGWTDVRWAMSMDREEGVKLVPVFSRGSWESAHSRRCSPGCLSLVKQTPTYPSVTCLLIHTLKVSYNLSLLSRWGSSSGKYHPDVDRWTWPHTFTRVTVSFLSPQWFPRQRMAT